MKVVINRCFGGFGISLEAKKMLGVNSQHYYDMDRYDMRTSPELIKVVETLGSKRASDTYARLEIVEVPDNATDWRIQEYDGLEDILAVIDGKIVDL